jgi:gliding motility-associated-like protein
MTCKNVLSLALLLILGVVSSRAQVSCPPNLDFELGTYANWHYYRGAPSGAESDGGGCCPISTPTYCGYGVPCSTPTVRHQLMSGAATDICCSFPVVPPGAGTYTMKLGNSSVGAQAEKLRYFINVPSGASSYSLFYRYAIVLQDPSHSAAEQPRFEVRAYDSATNTPLPCAQFSYVTTASLPGFYSVTSGTCFTSGGSPIRCKAWTTQSLNLSGMGGTTVAVDFATGDCDASGHYAYAYLDLNCGLFAITAVACGTSTITLSAPAGFAYYSWFDSTTFSPVLGTLQTIVIPTPPDTTTYACVIAPYPGFGCPDTVYTRVIPSNLQINVSNDTAICQGASAVLTDNATDIMAPISHSWAPATGLSCTTCGTVTATPTVTTTYTVTATNPVGCTKTDTIRVEVYQMNLVMGADSASCFGALDGKVRVTATGAGPFTYVWSTVPTQTTSEATGLAGSATYTVTVTSAAGCVATKDTVVGQPLPRTIAILRTYDDTTCFPYSPVPGLAANGMITLKGMTPKSIMSGFTYTVSYDYGGGTLTQICTSPAVGGDSLQLLGLPKGVYSNITIIGVAAPGYMCSYNTVGPTTINDPQAPVNAYINTPVACEGSPINFATTNITGVPTGAPIVYSWAGPMGFMSAQQNPTILSAAMGSAGTYTFAISTHGATCHDTAYTTVTVNPKPIPMGATSNSPICEGTTLTLWDSSSNGANSYSWAGPNGFSSVQQSPKINKAGLAAAGTYTVTMLRNGCVNIDSVAVIVNPTPPPPVVRDTVYCQGDAAAQLTAEGINLMWYTSPNGGTGSATAPTPSTASPGTTTWYVTQTSADGCTSDRAKIKVKVHPMKVPKVEVSDSVVCYGNRILFTAGNSESTNEDYDGIRWSFEGGESIENVNPVYHSFNAPAEYTYSVTVKYKVCPSQTVSAKVTVIPQPFINLGPDKAICPGSEGVVLSDNVNNGTTGAKWLWNTGETGSSLNITAPGTYYARVTIQGCSSYDSVVIARDCYLDVPNAFSPNGDGSNDYFFPRNRLSKGLKSFTMNIYNRWGELIFETVNLEGRGWDGSYNGAMQPSGVYVYIIDAEFKDGRKERQQGNVTLIK